MRWGRMTSVEQARQGEDEWRVRAAWDAAWAVEHGIDELRQAYARLVLNLNRARAITDGSRHRLPARALRRWATALELADQARQRLADGVAELRQVPGVSPIGGAQDIATALVNAADEVRASTAGLIELGSRIDPTAGVLGDVLPEAALARFREGAGALDELTARMQQGCAALGAYADGVSGVDLTPGRTARAAVLAQASWYPTDSVGVGAALAGRLVDQTARRPPELPTPAHLRVPAWRRVAWRATRGFWASGGSRLLRPRTNAAFFDDCLRALLLLATGNTIWYADRVDLFRRAGALDGYADALAAAVVVAVDRRLTRGRDGVTVRRLAARTHARYDGGTREVPAEAVAALIRAALGEGHPPPVDPVRLVLTQTLLLVDLLGDEQLSRADRAAFRAEAVDVALTIGPARLTVTPADQERDCDG